MFTVIQCEQRSTEWRKARAGRVTGSRASDVYGFLKSGGESAARRDYRAQLVAERLTGEPQDSDYVNADMQRGINKERNAIAAYEAQAGRLVRPCGFLAHPSLMAGCSLDGYVGDYEGIVEVKAPKTATHLKYLAARMVPDDYKPQLLHNLWISGAKWCDFVSFDDRLPEDLQVFIVRFEPEGYKAIPSPIAIHEAAVLRFLDSVDTELAAIRTMTNPAGVLREALV